jgi:hypothetical protein
LDERRATYAEADITIDGGSGSLGDVVDRAIQALRTFADQGTSS